MSESRTDLRQQKLLIQQNTGRHMIIYILYHMIIYIYYIISVIMADDARVFLRLYSMSKFNR